MYFTFEKYGVNCEQGDADVECCGHGGDPLHIVHFGYYDGPVVKS